MRHTRAGFSTALVLSVVTAVTAVVVIGLDRRTADLEIEGRTLCRAAARSAAESAIARGRARLQRAGAAAALQGTIAGGQERSVVEYTLQAAREGTAVRLSASGACRLRDAAPIVHRIEARFERRGAAWAPVEWSEPPPELR